MIDTRGIDFLQLVGADTTLKRVASTQGGEYHGPCPFCGGTDRFIIQVNRKGQGGRWYCRHCSPHWHDVIAYLQRRDGLDFNAACQVLGLNLQNGSGRQASLAVPQNRSGSWLKPKPVAVGKQQNPPALHSSQWQIAARAFTTVCSFNLWGPDGQQAREWLHKRGLPDQLSQAAGLGYNPQDIRMDAASWGLSQNGSDKPVWLPAGIVIPWYIDGLLWRINIRRFEGSPKYIGPRGNANGLYNAGLNRLGCTLVMVEGEFDALSIIAYGGRAIQEHAIVPAATGSVSGSRLDKWVVRAATASRILLAFDNDPAGEKAATWWRERLPRITSRLKPTQHDVNAMVTAGEDIEQWLRDGIAGLRVSS